MKYYIVKGSSELGPYTREEVDGRLVAGIDQPGDRARREGSREFFPLSTLLHEAYPPPPDIPWAVVLLAGLFTGGFFISVWTIVQFNWIRKLDKDPTALSLVTGSLVVQWGSIALDYVELDPGITSFLTLLVLLTIPVQLYAVWRGRATMLKYFNEVEPIGLRLNPLWSILITAVYFQYHLTLIAQRKAYPKG